MVKQENKQENKEEKIEGLNPTIDNLMLDMNGIFHNSAQKIYEYGNYKPKPRLLGTRVAKDQTSYHLALNTYKDVCKTIETIVNLVKPTQRLIMCVDGPAPLSKQNQQRQRRFMASTERSQDNSSTLFDSNCITPGTRFMDELTRYIDWYIRKQISDINSPFSKLEIIFSNEKAPGEGEHKLINYIRKYGDKNISYCLYGQDADLIMLALGTHVPNFWILREDIHTSDFLWIDINNVRTELMLLMNWGDNYDPISAVNDFIFMCFTVGNDFLPHLPGIEIIEGGIEFMLDVYKNTCSSYGHITRNSPVSGVVFRKQSLKVFLGTLSQYEKGILQNKYNHKDKFFPDPLLEKCINNDTLDIERYRELYYTENMDKNTNLCHSCHSYLDGMQWVLSYYTKGVPDWNWRYNNHYAPFAYDIAESLPSYVFKKYVHTNPTVPFVQLLCVLPPTSASLLPAPLDTVLLNPSKDIISYYPDEFQIDLGGKRQTWEGVAILPFIDYTKIERIYFPLLQKVHEKDRKRNILGKSFIYRRIKSESEAYIFKSSYGDFKSFAKVNTIDL